jgi:hypothetical protein
MVDTEVKYVAVSDGEENGVAVDDGADGDCYGSRRRPRSIRLRTVRGSIAKVDLINSTKRLIHSDCLLFSNHACDINPGEM